MSRRIITSQLQAAGQEPPDKYTDRIIKYIPGDILAAWLALVALLSGEARHQIMVLWVLFGVLLVLTPLWIRRVTRRPGLHASWTQPAMSAFAFAVWAFATGEPFSHYSFYETAYGGAALIVFTLVSGVVNPEYMDSLVISSRRQRTVPP